jgi:hypothetical protein
MSVLALKKFPDAFPNDVNEILNTMSFTNGEKINLIGSMSIRSQLYAGDYDTYEIIETHGSKQYAIRSLVRKFKMILRKLKSIPNTFIGDIKSGSIEDWKIIQDTYDYEYSIKKLEELHEKGILTPEEYSLGKKEIKPTITKLEHLILQRELRPNIIRWKYTDVMKGYKKLADGSKFTLEKAFDSPVITKLDVISWVQNNRFTEFSMIYTFKNNGTILNQGTKNVEESLRENIFVLHHELNYFKMAKRIFSLAKYKKHTPTLKKLLPLFNGDIGRIYIVYSDIGTLEDLLETSEKLEFKNVEYEIDQFKALLSNINLVSYISHENHIFNLIDKLVNMRRSVYSKTYMLKLLKDIKEILERIMNAYSKGYLLKVGLFPRY